MNKTTCKVCGYVFELTKKRHYIAREKTELFLLPSNKMEPTLYDAFDCPNCGCHEAGTWFMVGGKDRQKNRAKTFPGLAKAMAEQLGRLLPPEGEKNNG